MLSRKSKWTARRYQQPSARFVSEPSQLLMRL